MLSILPIWAYIFLTVFITGYAFLLVFEGRNLPGKIGSGSYHVEDICMAGIMAVTVYAQIFSLFAGVGLVANIVLVTFCIVLSVFLFRKKENRCLFDVKRFIDKNYFLIFVLCAVLVMAYGSSRGYFHYDSDLYHGQAIHWIEDYGVVKGLGNLHGRLGYNSSSFALSALYSFAFLGGLSYHTCAGFMALLTLVSCGRIARVFKDKKVKVSDLVRAAGIWYICNIYDEMVSPASDYFTMLAFIYIVIRFLDGAEKKEDADFYGIYALMAFFGLTLKLSVGPLVILTFVPLAMLITQKRYSKIAVYGAAVLVIILPFLTRNMIISGRLFYPSTALDVFNVDWKIPEEAARSDSAYIIAFGRGYSSMDAASLPFSEWFSNWYFALDKIWKMLFYGGVMGSIFWIIDRLKEFGKKNKKEEDYVTDFTVFAVIVSSAFWLMSSPLVRYGQGYLLVLPAITWGRAFLPLFDRIGNEKIRKIINGAMAAFIGLFIIYKAAMTGMYIKDTRYMGYYLRPQDYGRYETHLVSIGNLSVYAPDSGDRTGYYDFPSVPSDNYLPGLYDPDDMTKGFKP